MRIAVFLSAVFALASSAQSDSQLMLTAEDVFREHNNLSRSSCKQRFPVHAAPAPSPQPDLESRLRAAALAYRPGGLASLQQALQPLTALPNGFLGAGDLYFCLGALDSAIAAYQSAPASRESAMRLAAVRLAQRRPDDALALADRFDPKEALALRAHIRLDSAAPDRIPAIIAELRTALTNTPQNHFLLATLGRAHLAAGATRTAQASLDDALRLQPDYVPALSARAILELSTGVSSTAISTAAEILRLRPGNPFALALQASAYISQGRVDDAALLLVETRRLDPDNHDATYLLGYIRFRAGDIDEAEKLLNALHAAAPSDTRGVLALAELDTARKQFDRALDRLDDALKKDPRNVSLLTGRANVVVRAGRLDDGVSAFRKLLENEPQSFSLRMSLAETYRQKGDWGQAAEQWKAAAAIRPNEVAPALNQAMALAQSGRGAEAGPIYERILRIDGNQLVALNNYAHYLAQQGKDLDTALRHALRASILAAGDPLISDTLGFVYLKRNEPKEAVKIFERLTTDFPKQPLFHIRMAQSLRMTGDNTRAQAECDLARPLLATTPDRSEFQVQCPAAK